MREQRKIFEGSNIEKLFMILMLGCIFLSALNFIDRYYVFIYLAVLFFLITPGRRFTMNSSAVVLVLFSTSMLIFNPSSQTMFTNMLKPFTFPLCYIMGLNLFVRKEDSMISLEKEENRVSTLIYILTIGIMIHFLLNMMTNWGASDRNVIDFWTKDDASATGQAVLACIMIGVAIAFLFTKVGKLKKTIAIVSLILIIIYNLILAGRTIFSLIIITTAFALICTCIFNRNKISKIVITIVVIVLALLILYSLDVFGIKTMFENSNFYNRFFGGSTSQGVEDDARFEHKLVYLRYFFDFPWGGGNIRELYGHSAHDLYLDTYDESSIFALITIVIYIIHSLKRMITCLRTQSLTFKTRLLIACVYMVCNVQFFLEPIMRGVPWLLASYCFIDGAVTNLLSQEKIVRFSALAEN